MQDTSALSRRIEDLAAAHSELRYALTRAPALLAELDAILAGLPEEMADTAPVDARVDYIEAELEAYAADAEEGETGHAMQRGIYLAGAL